MLCFDVSTVRQSWNAFSNHFKKDITSMRGGNIYLPVEYELEFESYSETLVIIR